MSLSRVSNHTQSNGFVNKSADLHRQCVPPLCAYPGNTHVQSNTALQRALTAYETGFFASFTALALSTYNVGTSLPFPPSSPGYILAKQLFEPSLAAINSASVDNATDRCGSLVHAIALLHTQLLPRSSPTVLF